MNYTCNAEFLLQGDSSVTCSYTGEWSDAPHCVPIGSSPLPVTLAVFVIPASVLLSLVIWYNWKMSSPPTMKRNRNYDAFVCYQFDANHDFVMNTLKPNLEPQFKLFIHSFDFVPGIDIFENIENAVQNSNCAIILLWQEFVNSQWCREEFNFCCIENQNDPAFKNLVILMQPASFFQNIDGRCSARIRNFVKYKTCLEAGDKNLWKTIASQLTDVKKGQETRRSCCLCLGKRTNESAKEETVMLDPPPRDQGDIVLEYLQGNEVLRPLNTTLPDEETTMLDTPLPDEETAMLDIPLPDEETTMLDTPLPDEETAMLDTPLPDEETTMLDTPLPDEETTMLDTPLPDEETTMLDTPLPDEETAMLDTPLPDEETAMLDTPPADNEESKLDMPQADETSGVSATSEVEPLRRPDPAERIVEGAQCAPPNGRFGPGGRQQWRGSARLKFQIGDTDTNPSFQFYWESMTNDQMVSVSPIWQLGHIGKGADVFAEPPWCENLQPKQQQFSSWGPMTRLTPSHLPCFWASGGPMPCPLGFVPPEVVVQWKRWFRVKGPDRDRLLCFVIHTCVNKGLKWTQWA